ncbi:MAG TPA: thioredoxin [Puia sp.]|nr:thioredoxin [Puia sp.]
MAETGSFHDLIHGDRPVLVDFSAEWCGPCKMMPPILKELKDNMKDSLRIVKLDIDKNPQVARAYQIQSVPTLVLFQRGEIKWRQSGVIPARQLEQTLKQALI